MPRPKAVPVMTVVASWRRVAVVVLRTRPTLAAKDRREDGAPGFVNRSVSWIVDGVVARRMRVRRARA